MSFDLLAATAELSEGELIDGLEGATVMGRGAVAEERFAVVLEHARNAIAFERDEERAMLEFRKHLGWYTKGLPDGRTLRQELFTVKRLADAEALLQDYAARTELVAA